MTRQRTAELARLSMIAAALLSDGSFLEQRDDINVSVFARPVTRRLATVQGACLGLQKHLDYALVPVITGRRECSVTVHRLLVDEQPMRRVDHGRLLHRRSAVERRKQQLNTPQRARLAGLVKRHLPVHAEKRAPIRVL